jgi:hypothetical protein
MKAKSRRYRKSWLNPKIEIRPSPTHSRGLFARVPITKGEVVVVWGAGSGYVRKSGEDPSYFRNHSCDPNTWMEDEVTSTARRNIEANEELTIDYAMYETDENRIIIEECVCGSVNCRKRITGRDWRRRDLQEQYEGHFLPVINTRIAALQASSSA